jgi:broad specificity phosphatase PhoE
MTKESGSLTEKMRQQTRKLGKQLQKKNNETAYENKREATSKNCETQGIRVRGAQERQW